MIEFDREDLDGLAEVGGVVAHCDGKEVAIGESFDYETIGEFAQAYIAEHGLQGLLDKLGFDSFAEWLDSIETPQDLEDEFAEAFDFEDADEVEADDKAWADDMYYAEHSDK